VAGKEEEVNSRRRVMARLEDRSQKEEYRLHRRVILLVGFSAFPLLQKFGAMAEKAAARGWFGVLIPVMGFGCLS
jgi:hypothetical protein